MNSRTLGIVGGVVVAAAIVAAVIFSLQNFNAEEISCDGIDDARASLQAQYDSGVAASVQIFSESRTSAEQRLSQCLSASPKDPCAAEQAARDAAYKAFFDIESPADDAPYAEFQTYFQKRDDAYNAYKTAKAALDQCRTANPPNYDIPYEQSDTKACFDEYDASINTAHDTFSKDTQTMRAALQAALAALDAREKACNPPTEAGDKFTALPGADGMLNGEDVSENIQGCMLLDANTDAELFALRQRAAALQTEIDSVETTLENAAKRLNEIQVDLSEVDTYIPPESSKTQFEGALNALRAQRKISLEFSRDYYRNLIERKQAEKYELQGELADVNAQIAARMSEIEKENQMREQKYPTTIHLAKPESGGCAYYHCHGMLCGIPDPASSQCGHGVTSETDIDCKAFFNEYLKAAGVQ